MQIFDGPYIAFVTSVKLESAFLAISLRDKQSDDLQAQLEQQQSLRGTLSLSLKDTSSLKSTVSVNDVEKQRDQLPKQHPQ